MPTIRPDRVVASEWKDCETCGAPLGPPEFVNYNIHEEAWRGSFKLPHPKQHVYSRFP
ncbi:MAG: hypothetical protein QMC89_00325 [Candidatus Hodarchaeaceae archaeon]|nr:hypothetical protein [Candidatus Hodarchaeaceae archaeon]